jgi:hypothetical protein
LEKQQSFENLWVSWRDKEIAIRSKLRARRFVKALAFNPVDENCRLEELLQHIFVLAEDSAKEVALSSVSIHREAFKASMKFFKNLIIEKPSYSLPLNRL